MNAATARTTRLTTVAMCPVACPVAIPLTTMNTAQQGRNGAAQGSNWDGTLPRFQGSLSHLCGGQPLLVWRSL